MSQFTVRFYPVREEKSRLGLQTGPTREFSNLAELDDFMAGLSSDVRDIAWVTWPDGKEEKYIAPSSPRLSPE